MGCGWVEGGGDGCWGLWGAALWERGCAVACGWPWAVGGVLGKGGGLWVGGGGWGWVLGDYGEPRCESGAVPWPAGGRRL